MAIVLEVSLTLNPVNQIAYLADLTSLVEGTEYVINATYLQNDTRFTFHGNLDITLTKPPQGVPAPNTVVPAEITTVPLAAPPPAPVIYPFSTKDRLDASNLNNTFEFSPGPLPPQSALGGAGRYKYWMDTSVTPAVLRQCVVARASLTYVAAEWVTVGTVDNTGFKLGAAGGTLTSNLTVPRIVYTGAPQGFSFTWDGTKVHTLVDGVDRGTIPFQLSALTLPVPIASGGTAAATAPAALASLGAVAKGGDTMTGNLTAPGIHVTNNVVVDGPLSVGGTAATGSLTVTGNVSVSGQVAAAAIQYPTYGIASPASNIGFVYSYSTAYLWVAPNGAIAGPIAVNISDERLKRDVRPISVDPLAMLRRVQLKAFNQVSTRNDPADGVRPHDVGFIAQQLREIIPDAVIEPPTPEAFLGIDLMPLVAYCIGAIQQLAARLEALEGT